MKRIRTLAAVGFIVLISHTGYRTTAATGPDNAVTSEKPVDFARDVYPILRRSCLECHGEKKQEAGLRLDRRDDALEFGVIDPGNADDSELLRRITLQRGDADIMPPIGDALPQRQVTVLRRWIEHGADWPEQFQAGQHWAYVVPRRPPLPPVSTDKWAKTPIDRFVLRRLDEEQLAPSPPAAPEKLVRRVFLDLIGLPPTPEEIDVFVSQPTSERFEKLVDDLLRRPQFGERWARPWLDLARYADSHGFQRDNLRDVWAYRDWVIRALNADMPFDQFTIEQIAGDLLPHATQSQRIATGFHRCAPTNVEAGSLPEETRSEQVIDRVNTTGAVWLGTTLECCQCHDHKYDPFTTKDYYRLLAFFNNTEMEADRTDPKKPSSIQFKGPSMALADAERDAQRSELQQQIEGIRKQLTTRRKVMSASLDPWVADLAKDLAEAPRVHRLDIADFQSQGTTDTVTTLEDGSILLMGGDPPETDVYTIHIRTELSDIRAFRLDALRNDSLPGKGPGRGDPRRRNFVLNDFSLELRPVSPETGDRAARRAAKKQRFTSATASFSQKNWNVAGAIDNDPKSGWAIAPSFDKSHRATFILAEPLEVPEGSELVFTLTQNWGRARTIGCLRLSAVTGNVEAESVPNEIARLAPQAPAQWSKKQRAKLLEYRITKDPQSGKLDREVSQLEKRIEQLAPDTTLVMVELPEARKTAVFERGDYRIPGESVQPGTPEVLHRLTGQPANRLALARWLVSRDNPLVARVTVNRWWAELFGQGIVSTVEDFGIKGEPPTHPELLDWLAVEFVENGWSIKKMLKTMVLSATYQQSSLISGRLLARDDHNRLLARGPRFRMDAEMIRDNALAISGLLNLKQFGEPIRPFQPNGIWKKVGGTAYNYEVSPGAEQYRRGVYIVLKRGSPYPSFVNFDATARLACTVRRSRTNTPLQALTLLNDPVYVEAADSLAKRVLRERIDAPWDTQLDYGFQLCTARKPSNVERRVLKDLHQRQIRAFRNRASDATAKDADVFAWQCVATVLLNMHETITKD